MPGTWTMTSSSITTYSYKTGQEILSIFTVGEYVSRKKDGLVYQIKRLFWYDGEWCFDAIDSNGNGGSYRSSSFEKIDFDIGL
jgi:hypothetical protein